MPGELLLLKQDRMGTDKMEFKNLLDRPEYEFLRTNPELKDRVLYLTVSGSYAYGTNVGTSDIDVRGIAVENQDDIFLGREMSQVEDNETDTVIYGLRKYVSICRDCNPNSVEMLGTLPEHILYMNEAGKEIRNHVELFLSKRAYQSFSGYAANQLRRIQNAMAHDSYPQAEKEKHIMKSIDSMMMYVKEEYALQDGAFTFSVSEGENPEVKVSVNVSQMPLRKFNAVNSQLHTLMRNYDKLNHRNRKKDEAHLRKHAMHLVRLYLTGLSTGCCFGFTRTFEEMHDFVTGMGESPTSKRWM